MNTKFIMNNTLLNKNEKDIRLDKNQLGSIEMFSSIPEKQSKNIKTPSTVLKANTLEKNNDWIVNKKDSEKTIINNEECHIMKNKRESGSLSFIEHNDKVRSSKFNVTEESLKSVSTTTKSEQFSHSETLINEKSIRTISTKTSEQNSHSETFIYDESYKKPEHNNDSLDSLYEFSSLVNEIDDNLLLPYEVEGYEEKNHKNVLDINNADLNVLSLSSLNEEIRANEIYNYNYYNNKNLQLIESQESSGITISDDSISYDNIFNYNSDIILSDDEEIRKSKVNELYNEAVIMKNLDDNTFSFVNEDSYNEYFNNSIDNSENSDYSLFERDPNINHSRTINNQEVSDSPELIESNDLLMNNDHQKNNPKIIYKDVKSINNISSKSNNINDANESAGVVYQSNNNDYVNADDDAIYIVEDNNNNNEDEIQCVEEKIKSKKKVTFNEKVKVKRIDKIIIKEETSIKNYIKDELKFGLRKLKKLLILGRKKEKENNRSIPIDLLFYKEEFPIITIEYVDDYSDSYHKKELIYSNENCPRIVIDYIDDFSSINSNEKNENINNNYEDDNEINFIFEEEEEEEEEEIKVRKNIIKSKQKKRYEKNNKNKENTQNIFIKPILVNNNIKPVIEINQVDNSFPVDEPVIEISKVNNSILVDEPVMEINQVDNSLPVDKLDKKDEKLPFYLREEVPSKRKEKQKKAKKFIDKLMRMERNYYKEEEKASHELDKNDQIIKENKDIENSMSNSQEENIKCSNLNASSNSIDDKGSFNSSSYSDKSNDDVVDTSISKQKPTLKKKSVSMNYIKNVYKTLKHAFSTNDTSNNNNLDDEGINIYENNACILGMNLNNENKLTPNTSNQTLERNNSNTNNMCSIEETNSINNMNINKILKENVDYKNSIVESKDEKENSKDDINKVENKLQKYQSSLATMVADVDVIDVANINIINDDFNVYKNEEIFQKKKGWSSLITLFKKSKHINSEKQIIDDDDDIDNNKNLNILKSNNTNFNLSNSNVKNLNKTSQTEEIELSNSFEKENQNQKEIEKYNNLSNLDKTDSSLTETDILARQISRISDSIEIANNSVNDYTQILNHSTINENNAFVNTNINLSSTTIVNQNTNDELDSKIETKTSFNEQLKQINKSPSQKLYEIVNDINNSEIKNKEINKYNSSNSNNLESQIIHKTEKEIIESENIKYTTTTTTKKVFSPVILPIDKENDFNKVDTIEIIDEYIFNCSKPCLFNTNNGEKEEINEILIEDKFLE